MKHHVKSWPEFYWNIFYGKRTHELRLNDRNYQVGDILVLEEYRPEVGYTGHVQEVEITSMTSDRNPCAVSGEGLSKGYCILSIRSA